MREISGGYFVWVSLVTEFVIGIKQKSLQLWEDMPQDRKGVIHVMSFSIGMEFGVLVAIINWDWPPVAQNTKKNF